MATVTDQIAQLLHDPFGFSELREGQREVMSHLLEGRSAAAVFPTGGGKSLCYQLPALAMEGLTLVVSPLIALMKDQIDQLAAKGVEARRLDSSLSADEHREAMEGTRDGRVKLLYVAPERFNNERFLAAINNAHIAMMAIDEAHCISEWGHNFRPDYLKLAEFSKQCGAERVLALTATATPQVLEDICGVFQIEPDCAIRTPFHRPNLHLGVAPTTPATRDEMLLTCIGTREPGPTIVYVTLQKTAEQVADRLAQHGWQAKAYHAGMNAEQRVEIQDWFMASQPELSGDACGGAPSAQPELTGDACGGAPSAQPELSGDACGGAPSAQPELTGDACGGAPSAQPELTGDACGGAPSAQPSDDRQGSSGTDGPADHRIVVATIAFGMGVDKADIRYVYHYNFPKSLENYSQEIGRAGRDGEPSVCEVVASLEDLRVLENFVYGDTPAPESVFELVQWLAGEGVELELALHELSHQFDIRQIVIRTLLTYLELDGYLKSGTPFYASYQFEPILSSQQILAKFEGERRDFLDRLFRLSRKARKWLHLDVDRAATELKTSRDRIVKALDYLGEQQMLNVRAAGVRHRYQVVRPLEDPQAIASALSARMSKRESGEIQRLQQVVELFTGDRCLTDRLSSHFGEPLAEKCGHCSYCVDGESVVYETPADAPIDESVLSQLPAFRREHQSALPTTRAVARFLCGITSPRASRARLGRHQWFGVFEHTPFQEVLSRLT